MKNREDIVNAIIQGDINTVEEYITQADKVQINEQDDAGNTLLHVAVKHLCGSYISAKIVPDTIIHVILLLVKYVNRRLRRKDGKLAVHILWECKATLKEQCMIPVLEELLTEEYIEEECYWKGRFHILHDAARFKMWDVVRVLLQKNIDVSVENRYCFSALSCVVEKLDVPDDIVDKLSHPDVINKQDSCGFTPLMLAASEGTDEMVKRLVHNGADNTVIGNSYTALIYAVSYNNKLSVESLRALIHPRIVNHKQKNKETALHLAAFHGNVMAIEELLKAGADVGVTNDLGYKPIDNLCRKSLYPEAAVIEKLIPNDGEDYSDALISFVHRSFYPLPRDVEDAVHSISMLLLRTGKDDIFKTHSLRYERNGIVKLFIYNSQIQLNSNIVLFDMFGICFLVRKGMGCRTRPDLAGAISAEFDPSSNQVKQALKMESLWNDPNSLSELCCFTIRDNLTNPSKHQIRILGLPKALEDIATFRKIAREFCTTVSSEQVT